MPRTSIGIITKYKQCITSPSLLTCTSIDAAIRVCDIKVTFDPSYRVCNWSITCCCVHYYIMQDKSDSRHEISLSQWGNECCRFVMMYTYMLCLISMYLNLYFAM